MNPLHRFVLAAAAAAAPLLAAGNVAVPSPESAALPAIGAIPLVLQYEFFPKYYSQNLSGNSQYSKIEGYVDDASGQSKVRLVLTENKTGKETYYTNDQAGFRILKAQGLDAVMTPIDFVKPASSLQNVTAGFGFRDRGGQPIRWRFVYAYSVSPMGGGPTPAPGQPGLSLIYRNQGTVAGAGAAVQVASKVSEVQVWKEISQPPFFVAYQGFYTEGLNVGKFVPLQQTWQLPAIQPGTIPAAWELSNAEGQKQSFSAKRSENGSWTIATRQPGSRSDLEMNVIPGKDGYKLVSLTASQDKHRMLVKFKQPLLIDKGASGQADFQVELDKQKLSQGRVTATENADGLSLEWQFKSPDWAKARVIHEQLKFTGGELAMRVSQP